MWQVDKVVVIIYNEVSEQSGRQRFLVPASL